MSGNNFLWTKKKPYIKFRDAIAATNADSANSLATVTDGLTDGYFKANLRAKSHHLANDDNGVQFSFAIGATGDTAEVEIWGHPKDSDLEFVGNYLLTGGASNASGGGVWVDTISLGTDGEEWVATPTIVDEAGADRVSRVKFDASGCADFVVWINSIEAGSTLSCYCRGY